jgi:hypothetical protein
MTDAAPATSHIQTYRLEPQHTRFLRKQQVVYIDMKDQLVTLVSGSLAGPANLVSCRLTPTTFRALVILLLAAPDIASYAQLYAGLSCSDERLEALVSLRSLSESGFQTLVQRAKEQLSPLREEELKRQLVPVRHALVALKAILAQKRFAWRIVNKYNIGYMLMEANPS